MTIKKSQKNIVLIILILLVFGSMFMTMNYAKSHVTNNTMMQGNGPGAMPDNGLNDNSNSGSNDNKKKSTDTNSNTGNMQEPPEKPDGDNDEN